LSRGCDADPLRLYVYDDLTKEVGDRCGAASEAYALAGGLMAEARRGGVLRTNAPSTRNTHRYPREVTTR
jgi:hypothetical protein